MAHPALIFKWRLPISEDIIWWDFDSISRELEIFILGKVNTWDLPKRKRNTNIEEKKKKTSGKHIKERRVSEKGFADPVLAVLWSLFPSTVTGSHATFRSVRTSFFILTLPCKMVIITHWKCSLHCIPLPYPSSGFQVPGALNLWFMNRSPQRVQGRSSISV